MSYNYTTNLGNEVQSIAARRFLPKIDYYIDHEKIHLFNKEKDVKMIMNGWYLDSPEAWPPSNYIDPLLVSMHFNTSTNNKKRVESLLTDESLNYLSSHEPIGCRDIHTVNFLKEHNIDAYFSGCLTLTLDSGKDNDSTIDEGYIVINSSIPNEIYSLIKEKTNKEIYFIQQDAIPSFDRAFPETMPKWLYNLSSFYNYKEKFFIAENILKLYENASCVITDRLHCALPCLAFKTPVLLLNNRGMRERFNGLNDLLNETSINEYKNDYNMFDVENPPENSNRYLKIRKDLIEKCKKFTGHVNSSYYSKLSNKDIINKNTLIISRNGYETRNYMVEVLNMAEKYQKEIDNLKKINNNQKTELEKQKKIIDEMKNSNSWKITSPLRKIRNRK